MILKQVFPGIKIDPGPLPPLGKRFDSKKVKISSFGPTPEEYNIGYRKGSKDPYVEKLMKM